jgi:hypothetical protein
MKVISIFIVAESSEWKLHTKSVDWKTENLEGGKKQRILFYFIALHFNS